MSEIKVKCILRYKWGQPLITAYGTYDVDSNGVVSVPKMLADKLLTNVNYEKVESAPKKSAPKKGDLNKDGKVDSKDVKIAKSEKSKAEKEVAKADEKVEDVLGDLTKKELLGVAKDLKLKKADYQTLNKESLKEFIAQNS